MFVFFRKATSGQSRGGAPADLESLPDSVIETSRPVKLKDFAEHYRIMSADSDFRYSLVAIEVRDSNKD